MKRSIYIAFLFWLAASCTAGKTDSSPLERALQAAGENRGELEKVLAHYSQDPADSLKLKAARFLIENMPGHWGIDSASISGYIARVDSLPGLPHALRRLLLDVPARYPDSFPQAKRVEDIRIVKAQDLIGQVDWAFRMKDSCPWLEHIGFDMFCEGILPYRIAHEPLDFSHGQPDSILQAVYDYAQQHYDDCQQSSYTMTMFIQRTREFQTNYAIKDKKLRAMLTLSRQEDKLATIRLRDLGIPVTMDYNPAEAVPTSNRRWSTPFDPRLFTKSYYEITQMGSGKFYRQTYAHNPIPAPTDREEHVPAFFRDPFQKDVTSIYLHTADVEIPVSLPAGKEYAYLAMYNKEEWVPVAFAKAENGKCRFRDLGVDALYLPVHYPEGRMEALGAPFVLYCNGKTQAKGGTGERKKLCIERTEPYQGKFEYQGEEFPGSCFECDDNRNFQSADTVYIEKEMLNYRLASTALASTPTARFWRFTPNSNYVVMAELHFINEKGQILQGKYIPEDAKHSTDLTDEDSQTFRIIEDALSIDFGKPVSVCGIEYMIFSGQGNVRNGHEYELFYFQEGAWHSAGKEKARNYRVVFDNVPAGCLYQVVDRTEETRGALFTQENGRIRYW